jgi:hypothetical protein
MSQLSVSTLAEPKYFSNSVTVQGALTTVMENQVADFTREGR